MVTADSPVGSPISDGPLVYFAAVGEGGLSKYAVLQAAAMSRLGADVVFLGYRHMSEALRRQGTDVEFIELDSPFSGKTKVGRALSWIRNLRVEADQAVNLVAQRKAKRVLLTSYAEYFAPFWAGKFRRLQNQGVRIGSIVHDPVRDHQIGPPAWHRYCVSLAYSFVDVAFLHDDTPLDTGSPSRQVSTEIISLGPFEVPDSGTDQTRAKTRLRLGIDDHAKVLLSFGHVRDGKNLDLLIESLVHFPELHLLVVGREQSSTQRPIAYYRQLADQHSVAERCHWVNEFVPDAEIHQYFYASDYLSLLYSSDFHSASGVLSLASQFELPVIASSGGGPLRQEIETYQLGQWVPPDRGDEVISGLKQLEMTSDEPMSVRWERYRRAHSWETNARKVLECL